MKIVEIAGLLVGLVYLYLEYKASVWLWAASIVMPLIYTFVFYDAGFYAGMALNIYYLVASIYGWIVWLRKGTTEKPMPITHTPRKYIAPLAILVIVILVPLAWILITFTDSPAPIGDSLVSALSVAGILMLAHKRLEHWFVWVAVNAISTGLYIYTELYPTALYFFISTIISVAGYCNWRKMMRDEQKQ